MVIIRFTPPRAAEDNQCFKKTRNAFSVYLPPLASAQILR